MSLHRKSNADILIVFLSDGGRTGALNAGLRFELPSSSLQFVSEQNTYGSQLAPHVLYQTFKNLAFALIELRGWRLFHKS